MLLNTMAAPAKRMATMDITTEDTIEMEYTVTMEDTVTTDTTTYTTMQHNNIGRITILSPHHPNSLALLEHPAGLHLSSHQYR